MSDEPDRNSPPPVARFRDFIGFDPIECRSKPLENKAERATSSISFFFYLRPSDSLLYSPPMKRRVLALAVLALSIFPAICHAQSTLSFARAMQPADFRTTGFAVVNPAATSATVSFSLYGAGGSPEQVSTLTIPARGQAAKLASELFTSTRASGWVQATSDTTGLQGFWFAGDFSTFADGAEAAPSSNELVLPLIAPQSEIDIANTGNADVTLMLHLLGEDGGDLWTAYPKRIPPKGFFKADVATLFVGIDDFSASRHMRIECGCPDASYAAAIIARDFIAGPSWAVANAVPASQNTFVANFPHFVEGPQGSANWRSVLGITNLSKTSANDVTITFMSETGTPLRSPVERTLPPNGGLRAFVRDFGVPPGFQNGWIRVMSTSGLPLTGFVTYADTAAGGVAVVPPQLDAEMALLFSHIADLAPWFTGLALLNTNKSAANVGVFALNPSGTLIGKSEFALQPGTKTAKLLSELIPQTQNRASDGGFLFIQSDLPLFGIELFFSRNLQILSNVAAGRVLPGITFVLPAQ